MAMEVMGLFMQDFVWVDIIDVIPPIGASQILHGVKIHQVGGF